MSFASNPKFLIGERHQLVDVPDELFEPVEQIDDDGLVGVVLVAQFGQCRERLAERSGERKLVAMDFTEPIFRLHEHGLRCMGRQRRLADPFGSVHQHRADHCELIDGQYGLALLRRPLGKRLGGRAEALARLLVDGAADGKVGVEAFLAFECQRMNGATDQVRGPILVRDHPEPFLNEQLRALAEVRERVAGEVLFRLRVVVISGFDQKEVGIVHVSRFRGQCKHVGLRMPRRRERSGRPRVFSGNAEAGFLQSRSRFG